jgi:hypothetical protein
MARVCKHFKQCGKVLIDDQGVIRNHPNKVINEDGGTEWLCDECLARVGVKKTEDQKAKPAKTEDVSPEEATPETEKEVKKTAKKAAKKGGKKK